MKSCPDIYCMVPRRQVLLTLVSLPCTWYDIMNVISIELLLTTLQSALQRNPTNIPKRPQFREIHGARALIAKSWWEVRPFKAFKVSNIILKTNMKSNRESVLEGEHRGRWLFVPVKKQSSSDSYLHWEKEKSIKGLFLNRHLIKKKRPYVRDYLELEEFLTKSSHRGYHQMLPLHSLLPVLHYLSWLTWHLVWRRFYIKSSVTFHSCGTKSRLLCDQVVLCTD